MKSFRELFNENELVSPIVKKVLIKAKKKGINKLNDIELEMIDDLLRDHYMDSGKTPKYNDKEREMLVNQYFEYGFLK